MLERRRRKEKTTTTDNLKVKVTKNGPLEFQLFGVIDLFGCRDCLSNKPTMGEFGFEMKLRITTTPTKKDINIKCVILAGEECVRVHVCVCVRESVCRSGFFGVSISLWEK